jgi:Na+/H+-dicarboxylate symporter
MFNRSNHWFMRFVLLFVLALAYFVIFPQDWSTLLSLAERILAVSNAVSPWLYGLLGVGLVCWTMIRIWGKATREAGQEGQT